MSTLRRHRTAKYSRTRAANGSRPHRQVVAPLLPFVTITDTGIEGNNIFELWFNIDAPGNEFEIDSLNVDEHLRVSMETAQAATHFLQQIPVSLVAHNLRNVFEVRLDEAAGLLRFTFNIARIRLTDGRTVQQYVTDSGIKFLGHDGGRTVTVFVRGRRVQG